MWSIDSVQLYQIPVSYFIDTVKEILKLIGKIRRLEIANSVLKAKKCVELTLPNFYS